MPSFSTVLVSGTKRPYDSWTFVVVPDHMVATLGSPSGLGGALLCELAACVIVRR